MRFLVVLIRNVLALSFGLLGFFFRLFRQGRRPRVVRFLLKGNPPYRAGVGFRFRRRKSDPAQVKSLSLLKQQCDKLAKDKRVEKIVFELDGFEAPAPRRKFVVDCINQLRAAGKQVFGYATQCTTPEYELLCACDKIYMTPAGRLELTGYAAEAFTIGQFLKKWGVSAHFVRRGEHKTAPEMFTHDEVSPIQKKTLETLLDERFQHLLTQLEMGRGIEKDAALAKIDAGPFSARRAQKEGLVDALKSPVELAQSLVDEDSVELPPFAAWSQTRLFSPTAWKPLRSRPRIAVVPIRGMISHGAGGGLPLGPEVAGSDEIIRNLREAAEDPISKGIILDINSPGGSALGSELILEEVKRAQAKKPVLAYVDQVAASGGYMAALGAREIWTAPLAIIGSIGVFAGKFDVSGLLGQLGVAHAIIQRGQNSAIFSPTKPFSDSERAALETDVEETYEVFLEFVAAARRMTRDEVHKRAEGRIYSGNAALSEGLVDRVGSFEEAGRRVLEWANVSARDFDLQILGARKMSFPLLSILQKIQSEHVWALGYPWVVL